MHSYDPRTQMAEAGGLPGFQGKCGPSGKTLHYPSLLKSEQNKSKAFYDWLMIVLHFSMIWVGAHSYCLCPWQPMPLAPSPHWKTTAMGSTCSKGSFWVGWSAPYSSPLVTPTWRKAWRSQLGEIGNSHPPPASLPFTWCAVTGATWNPKIPSEISNLGF